MLAFTSDRFLSTDSVLRILVLAHELGATSVTAVRALDLRLAYVLRDRTTGNAINLETTQPLKEEELAYLRVPWSYGHFPLKNIAPGSYTLEAIQGAEDVVAHAPVVVLAPWTLGAVIDELANEKPAASTAVESGDALRRSWEAAWNDLYSYLKVRIPTHIAVSVPQPLKTSSSTPQRFSQESFRWVLFHTHRVVFGAVLLGGTAAFTQSSENPLQFRYTIQSRVPVDPGIVDGYLIQLRRLIKATDYTVTFQWKLDDKPTPPFRQRALLDVTWTSPTTALM